MAQEIKIGNRKIGNAHRPLVIAEIGINHEGRIEKAYEMIDDAHRVGCECVKFQCHVVEDEMIPNEVIPGNATESIWAMMKRCQLAEQQEALLKQYTESKGMLFLSTPFSRAAADRLENMGVLAYKIGSGECNNYPLIEHIAGFRKPVILSTGMNDIVSIKKAVSIIESYGIPYALLHCTSIYPTPYEKVRLGALGEIKNKFPNAVVGLSDHSIGNYTSFAAVALGASIIEKHFTSNKAWPGSDISLSIDPEELKELIVGSEAIYQAGGASKTILSEEQKTIDFAYACVVSIKDIKAGDFLSAENIWVKRPGTGEIKAENFKSILGKKVKTEIKANSQIKWSDIGG
ncbi:MAG: N-acetylneuraminate synthase family protein [Candidatus Omnitrophica bacterium]|nr:N-acetylneuraminate synthase family protein [Candidatus Omnitrophota bacterium]